jgi:hypothetical protein
MKQTIYRFTLKRKLSFRLERLARRAERWIDDNPQSAFFVYVLVCLFAAQVLLWLHAR